MKIHFLPESDRLHPQFGVHSPVSFYYLWDCCCCRLPHFSSSSFSPWYFSNFQYFTSLMLLLLEIASSITEAFFLSSTTKSSLSATGHVDPLQQSIEEFSILTMGLPAQTWHMRFFKLCQAICNGILCMSSLKSYFTPLTCTGLSQRHLWTVCTAVCGRSGPPVLP